MIDNFPKYTIQGRSRMHKKQQRGRIERNDSAEETRLRQDNGQVQKPHMDRNANLQITNKPQLRTSSAKPCIPQAMHGGFGSYEAGSFRQMLVSHLLGDATSRAAKDALHASLMWGGGGGRGGLGKIWRVGAL